MSTDLTLFPIKPKELQRTDILCIDRIRMDRDYDIFSQLNGNVNSELAQHIHPISLLPTTWVEFYEDEGIKRTRMDAYGDELTFVFAENLKKLRVLVDASPKNKAIKAYIDALPNDYPFILYWS